ncbi:MAG TPA: hypothetical protein VFX59_30775 [Polyangiales bacterium]|nr:hypothetical protein [Polyangiales bacterium]
MPLSPSALWGEVVAAVAVDAESRGVSVALEVEDDAGDLWADPEQAMRVFKNLTLAGVRLTARDACLRVRVRGTPEQQLIELESVISGGSADARPRLYRAARSIPSAESFAVNAVRSFLRGCGGSVEALYMQDLGIVCTAHIPRQVSTRNAG